MPRGNLAQAKGRDRGRSARHRLVSRPRCAGSWPSCSPSRRCPSWRLRRTRAPDGPQHRHARPPDGDDVLPPAAWREDPRLRPQPAGLLLQPGHRRLGHGAAVHPLLVERRPVRRGRRVRRGHAGCDQRHRSLVRLSERSAGHRCAGRDQGDLRAARGSRGRRLADDRRRLLDDSVLAALRRQRVQTRSTARR